MWLKEHKPLHVFQEEWSLDYFELLFYIFTCFFNTTFLKLWYGFTCTPKQMNEKGNGSILKKFELIQIIGT